MATPKWIRKTLEMRGVPFRECHHPTAYTAHEVAHQEHVSGHRVAKVVVVMADGKPVELVLPASRRVMLDRVRETLKAKEVRLATETEMERYFADCEVGAVPPLEHWEGVRVLMDEMMEVKGDILFQAGTHQDAIRLSFDNWARVVEPWVGSFTEPDTPHAREFSGREV